MATYPNAKEILGKLKDMPVSRTVEEVQIAMDKIPTQQVPANTVATKFNHDTIQIKFERYNYAHPEVYTKLVELARAHRDAGFKKIGLAKLWEQMRYHFQQLRKDDHETYKLNNDFLSRYSRLIMEQEDDLRGFFKTRALHTR